MGIRMQGFTPARRRAIRQSLALIARRLARPSGPIPQDLWAALEEILLAARPMVDVVEGGATGVCRGPYSRSAGYPILLCEKVFLPAAGAGRPRLTAVLFHELIHIARGWDLDAEAFENAWFSEAEGARPLTREDWRICAEDHYQGWWIRLDPRIRRVTDYADRLILTFPPPSLRRRNTR